MKQVLSKASGAFIFIGLGLLCSIVFGGFFIGILTSELRDGYVEPQTYLIGFFGILPLVFVFAGVKMIVDAVDVYNNGTEYTGLIVQYDDDWSTTVNDRPALMLVLAYLNEQNEITITKVRVGFKSEKKFSFGNAIKFKMYKNNTILTEDESSSDVPAELKAAADAYYEKYQSWRP